MTWWTLSFYLLVLLVAGAVFSAKKNAYPDRGTLFDQQTWSIWIGIFAATLLKSVSAIVLWSPWSFRDQPIIVPIYLLAEVSVFIAVLLFYRLITNQPLTSLGFSSDRFGIRLLFAMRWIIGVFLALYGIFYLLLLFQSIEVSQAWLMRLYRNRDLVTALLHFFEKMWGLPSVIVPILFMVVLRPFAEEIVFRGLLYGPIRRKSDPIMAALITSLLFTLADGSISSPHLLSGVLSAYLYERTEMLYPGMILHGLMNLGSVVYYFGGKNVISVVVRKAEAGWMTLFLAALFLAAVVLYRILLKKGYGWRRPVSIS
jgi:membrane protease YdiL (CAAX protease family)